VVRALAEAGHEVVLTSRREPSPELGKWPWVQGDLNVYEDCVQALRRGPFDAIQHLAAQPSPSDHPATQEQVTARGIPFDQTMRTNIMGTYYLLQAALQHDVGLFVMTGSNCAMGHCFRISGRSFPIRYLPVDEAHPSDVEDSYSYSKLAGELLLESYTRAYGMRTYAVRAAWIRNATERRELAENAKPVQGWADSLWAWVGSEDVASAHRLLMERAESLPPHDVYFCNADDTLALEPSMELIDRFRPEVKALVADPEALAGHGAFFSTQRLQDAVGWRHTTSWRQSG
jgi:nucleoside-diphosphate-sugar epimerase